MPSRSNRISAIILRSITVPFETRRTGFYGYRGDGLRTEHQARASRGRRGASRSGIQDDGQKEIRSGAREVYGSVQTMEKDDPIFISHGDCREDVDYLIRLLEEKFPGHEILVSYIGPVIGDARGCGTVCIVFQGIVHR